MTPVVFLPGFLGGPDDWQPLIDSLDGARTMLAPELPLAPDWQVGIDRLVEQLPDRFVLVGYSMGARVALGITLDCPRRVRGLCLIAGHPGIERVEREARRLHDDAVARRLVEEPITDFLDGWYRQAIFASITDTIRRAWIRQKQSLDRPYQAKLLRCYSLAGQPNYWSRLTEITVPTCIVVGEQDDKYVAIAEAIQRESPHWPIRRVSLSGHAVHREQPAALREILQTFLASLNENRGETLT